MTEDLQHNRDMLGRARRLRREQTPVERQLWSMLRNRQCGGHKFRRQAVIGNYIVDFLCSESMLIIELDGVTHEDREDYDARRTDWLGQHGYRVIRFTNQEIGQNLMGVIEAIMMACEEK